MKPSSLYTSTANEQLASTLDDLLISKSRDLVMITGLFFTVSIILLSGSAPTELMARMFLLSLTLGLVSFFTYRLMEHRYILAHVLWQSGLGALILFASVVLGRSEVLLLLAFMPMIATVTLGMRAGLLAQLLLTGLVGWLNNTGLLLPPVVSPLIIQVIGAFGGLLGWATTSHLMTAAEWALFSFNQARTNLAEAREQRLELQQTQEDLTKANQELARLADRLKILQRMAEEARQAKAEFVANVSHELRTPLNMIIGFTEVIAKSPHLYGSRLPTALLTDINAIQRNSQHLLTLVNDVLDLSQVEAGRMALSREWGSIQTMLPEAVAVVQSLFHSKNLYLNLDLPAETPQLFFDQTRIRQVLINLLSNAGRFTTQGGVNVTCRVDQDDLVVSVADTGPGIPAEDQKRIFEPFQQLDNSLRRQNSGSGLGLTISKQFIELHGGKMWLESQPKQGTTFFFSLPLSPSLTEEEAQTHQRIRRALIPGDEYGYTLRTRPSRAPAPVLIPRLVVYEQDQSLQRLLSRYLQDTEIVAASTPEEAADALNRSPAQALLINMPPFEIEAAKVLPAAPFGTPVISCWIPGEVEAANQLGVIQYLMKPLTREKLLSVLEDLPRQGAVAPRPVAGEIRRVLVVDDEPDELHLFARMLESDPHGYQVLQVTNGKRALDMLRSRQPDILLLDLMMPGMSGFQVLKEKAEDPSIRDIPVIVISSRDPLGEAMTGNTIRLSHSGGFTTSHLIQIIQTMTQILVPSQGKHS